MSGGHFFIISQSILKTVFDEVLPHYFDMGPEWLSNFEQFSIRMSDF